MPKNTLKDSPAFEPAVIQPVRDDFFEKIPAGQMLNEAARGLARKLRARMEQEDDMSKSDIAPHLCLLVLEECL